MAHFDRDVIVTHVVPESPPPVEAQRVDVPHELREVSTILNRIADHPDMPLSVIRLLQRGIGCVERVQVAVAGELFADLAGGRSKARAKTMAEVILFAGTVGLTHKDAEWFFLKCEGCGWKNNGRAIKDWQMTMRAWKLINVFPSQKVTVNGKAVAREQSLAEKQTEREYQNVLKMREGV